MSTMDDNARTLKIKVGEREYPAAPFGQAQIMALQAVRSVSGAVVIKILAGLVKFSLGEDAQADVLVMLADGSLDEHGLIKILMDVATATAAEKEEQVATMAKLTPTLPKPRTLDVAGQMPESPSVPDTFTGGQI